jgi:eukaryotic-like serine/threonine-protein kinase
LAANALSGSGDERPADLGGRCQIMPSQPLPDLDSPSASAFQVQGGRDYRVETFALIADRPVPARIEAMGRWRQGEHPHMLRLLDWGPVEWTQERQRRFAIILERPQGRRVMESLYGKRDPISDDALLRYVVPGLVSALRDLHGRSLVCGGLRPTNLFFKDSNLNNGMVIGDCVSTPCGYDQPAVFETIERSMAAPSGKGAGTAGDDLYALGVCLLALHMGRVPLLDLPETEILEQKLDKGSYIALVGQNRLSSGLVELARGCLSDDARHRWSIADVEMWVQSRRLSPKQPQIPRRAARPFELAGGSYIHCRSLSLAVGRNSAAAAPLVERGEVEKWVRRSVGDDARADAVALAMTGGPLSAHVGKNASQEDRLCARVANALDPYAPLHCRTLSVMPDGLGTALAEAMWKDHGVQDHAEIILAQLVPFWVRNAPDFRPDFVALAQNHESYKVLLEQTGMGFGIERLLYEMCPACPCLSPLVRDFYVLTPSDLLMAFESLAPRAPKGREPMDRHVAAFIAAHDKTMNDRMLAPLANQNDAARRLVALVNILADAQSRFGPAKLPQLCQWLMNLLDPAFNRLKNQENREKIKSEAAKAARDGVIAHMLRYIDNPDILRADDKGFIQAARRYDALGVQIARLRGAGPRKDDAPLQKGRRFAAFAAITLAAIIMGITAFNRLFIPTP